MPLSHRSRSRPLPSAAKSGMTLTRHGISADFVGPLPLALRPAVCGDRTIDAAARPAAQSARIFRRTFWPACCFDFHSAAMQQIERFDLSAYKRFGGASRRQLAPPTGTSALARGAPARFPALPALASVMGCIELNGESRARSSIRRALSALRSTRSVSSAVWNTAFRPGPCSAATWDRRSRPMACR